MLLAFIDTNIFFNNWHLRNPNFGVLANFLDNEDGTLLLSEVVRQEVEAKFRFERDKLQKSLTTDLRRATDFQLEPAAIANPALDGDFDFLAVVNSRFVQVELVDVDKVCNRELVPRAVSFRRPFRESEKGYRDTVIWLSLLEHLKTLGGDDLKLLFITNNSDDFFEKTAGDVVLHADLQEDLKAYDLDVEILPFKTVKELFGKEIDVGLHSVRHEQFRDDHGDEMEALAAEAAVAYLEAMSLTNMQSLLEAGGVPRRLVRFIRSFTVEDMEGVEDPEVISFEGLKDGSIYIGYNFNLLTVLFKVAVDLDDYQAYQDEFDDYFLNATVEGYSVNLDVLRRCDFEGGLGYRQDGDVFTPMTIDRAQLRSVAKYRWMTRSR